VSGDVQVRAARTGDVHGIAELVNAYAAQAVMLPRSAESIALALDDFVVAADGRGRVVACGALKQYSPSLGEVASVAVAREGHGRGVGRAVVAAVEDLAMRRGVRDVFALTLTPGFFESVGYRVDDRARYPEKMRRDCAACARRAGCVEICVSRTLGMEAVDAAA
jgi:amino-acid N-acetyltransferase